MTPAARRPLLSILTGLAALTAFPYSTSAASAAAAPPVRHIDFNRDIKPILSENCFACHGFDEKARKGKLRLDVPESAYAERKGIIRLKPGDPASSDVWQRIISTDEEEMMPPPKDHARLTPAQTQKIKSWIEEGAVYAKHWAFEPPVKATPPPPYAQVAVKGGAQPVNEIDAFVRARLVTEKLSPAPEADRRTLLRRVTQALTGLPPTSAELEAFVSDRDPHAYEKVVSRLLANPHFGERMALDWLDAARYADTNGFSIDGGRHLWLWRDWVIQAFNDNKPYDRFLVEQLAGDLLPNHTDADLIATGFERNNMVTHEGGTIPEENITNYNADRVKTLGEAVLGLTLGCAQCHDHKFDPITQQDYYRTFAFFNTLGDRGLDGNSGINPAPSIRTRTVLKADDPAALRTEIAALEARLAKPDDAILTAWEKRELALQATRGRDFHAYPLKITKISTPNAGSGFEVEGDNRVRIRQSAGLAAFDLRAELPKLSAPITALRVTMLPVENYPLNGWGPGPVKPPAPKGAKKSDTPAEPPTKGTFRLTAIAASSEAVPGDQVNLHKLEKFTRATANSWETANPPAACLDPRNETGWSPDLATEGPVHLTVTLARPIDSAARPYLTTQLNFGFGQGLIAGLVEIAAITGSDDDTDLPTAVVAALQTPRRQRTPEMSALLWRECSARSTELERTRTALANLRERVSTLTEPYMTMVMAVADKPRDTFILNRGDYAQPTVKVTAGTLSTLPPMPEGAPANRLGLAQWIVMKENPLTSRVAVNRLWKLLFGIGLVGTPADFGAQGEPPSHPELLDWLAVDFVEHGWDVKRLITQIVTSATYRQSSVATPESLDHDPANRLLARGPRFRLPAELVRDNALAVSGLLVPRVGGPSVNPYTPGDLWREVSHYGSTPATSQTFVQDHGEKLYRRSLYTYWKRTAPPPSMMAFDAPNREVCTVARGNTTTPLQALVTLNDPQFVEAARAFAERILAQKGSDASRLRWAFAECVSRPPTEAEFSILRTALGRERTHYKSDPAAALALLSVGESPRNPALPAAEHAAWAQIASTLLNLSETLTCN